MPGGCYPKYQPCGDPELVPKVSGDDYFDQAPAVSPELLSINTIDLRLVPFEVTDAEKPDEPNPPSFVRAVPNSCSTSVAPGCEGATLTAPSTLPIQFDVTMLCSGSPGDTIVIDQVSASEGTVTQDSPTTFSYFPPNTMFSGEVVITYWVNNQCLKKTAGTISITLYGIPGCEDNESPETLPASTDTCPDTPISFDLTPYVSDPNGQALVITAATASAGSVTFNGLTLDYDPEGASGPLYIEYTIVDTCAWSAEGILYVESVGDVVDPVTDAVTTPHDSEYLWPLLGKVVYTAGGATCTLFSLSNAAVTAGGSVAIEGQSVRFTGDGTEVGDVTLTVDALTSCGQNVPCTLTITLTSDDPCIGNLPPVTTPATLLMCGAPTEVIDVTDHAVDPDGFALTLTGAVTDVGSVVTLGTVITYTPPANYQGNATISYTVEDVCGASTPGTLTVKSRCTDCGFITAQLVWSEFGGMTASGEDGTYAQYTGTAGSISSLVDPPGGGVVCNVRITGVITAGAGVRLTIGGTNYFASATVGAYDYNTNFNFSGVTVSVVVQNIGGGAATITGEIFIGA